MKFCSMNLPSESEVESLLMSPCWGTTQNGSQDQYLLDGHKLLLEHDLDSLPSDSEQKNSLDVLDNLLLNSSSLNALSDLKPLPPFTGYTGHLSINGIAGHHYHAIAQRLPDESNNNYIQSAYQQHNTSSNSTASSSTQHGGGNNATTSSIQLAAAQSGSLGGSLGGAGGGGGGSGGCGNNHNSNNNNNNNNGNGIHGNSHGSNGDHNIVSSSTCLPESVLSPDAADACLNDVKLFADSHLDSKLYSLADSCVIGSGLSSNGGGGGNGGNGSHGNGLGGGNLSNGLSTNSNNGMGGMGGGGVGGIGVGGLLGPDTLHGGVRIYADAKDLTEYVDMNSIDDIAAIIGSAIADTTVPNQLDKDDGNDTRDSWMDLDAWIDGTCIQQDGKLVVSQQDSLSDFILPHSPMHAGNSTLQSLLTHGYMPLLQNRLQNGPPTQQMNTNATATSSTSSASASSSATLKNEASSSTSYCNELPTATSSTSSPPGSVVSTTDNLMINPRYLSNPQTSAYHQVAMSSTTTSMKSSSDGLCSPDLLGNYPHTTTITPTGLPKPKRSRSQKKSTANNNNNNNNQQQQQQQHHQQPTQSSNNPGGTQLNAISPSSVSFNASDLSGLLGKEKPVHRCSICNRGFLNKSNIKVHLRTHTGEKPFRCDVCAKAFRQKAHLLKHQQIHKRIGRD